MYSIVVRRVYCIELVSRSHMRASPLSQQRRSASAVVAIVDVLRAGTTEKVAGLY